MFELFRNIGRAIVYFYGTAATAAKSLQLCPTLCNPIDGSPPGSPVPGTLQARTLEWVAISFSNTWKWKVKVKSLSHVRLLATPWTVAYQAPLSMELSRQEYWSGLPFPFPFIEPGVLIIAKQANRWVITCLVVSPRRGVAHIKEEFVWLRHVRRKREKVQGNELYPFAIVHWVIIFEDWYLV